MLVGVSLSMILWGLRDRDRIYQFPLLAGSVWLFYVAFQALQVVLNPRWVPLGAQRDGGIEMALLMSVLCALSSFLGYLRPSPMRVYKITMISYSYGRLFVGGAVLIGVAYISFYMLAGLSGGIREHYSVGGSYGLEWSGLPVALVFFNRMVYPGLALCLLATLHKPNIVRVTVVIVGTLLPLANIILLGRRTEFVFLMLTFGLCFFFKRRWVPPRSWAVAAMIFGCLMVIAMPEYRRYSQIGADQTKILDIDVRELLLAEIKAERPVEFVYPVVQLPATQRALEFNYGLGFYNMLVKEWVPSILVGRDFKNALFIEGPDFEKHTKRYYSWAPRHGWIPLGTTDVFLEFWYFGAFLFFLIGWGFRILWDRSYSGGDLGYAVFYITLIPEAMLTILHGVTPVPFFVTYAALGLLPVLLFARRYTRAAEVFVGGNQRRGSQFMP